MFISAWCGCIIDSAAFVYQARKAQVVKKDSNISLEVLNTIVRGRMPLGIMI